MSKGDVEHFSNGNVDTLNSLSSSECKGARIRSTIVDTIACKVGEKREHIPELKLYCRLSRHGTCSCTALSVECYDLTLVNK